MIPIYKVGKENVFKDSKFAVWLSGVEATSAYLTPCRAKPVASKEAAIRGCIVADVVFGDQKHKLASLKTSQSF